ncbi:MAG: hypothetical protein R3B06_23330 [Kofleriaceae bacterium]
MTKLGIAALLVVATAGSAWAGSIRVYNSDSKTHTIELKCSGSSKSIEVRGSTTATYTFHSTAKSCDITGGTVSFPVGTLEDGQSWKFKDGKAVKN